MLRVVLVAVIAAFVRSYKLKNGRGREAPALVGVST